MKGMENRKNQSRLGYVDVVRVFAMVMVILLHCICDYSNHWMNFDKPLWWITAFVNELTRTGVPLFFMISGFLLIDSVDTSDIGGFYKRRFVKILIPFLIYHIFYYCYFRIEGDLPLLDIAFFEQLFVNGSAYHLWFVYSLFFLYLFIPFIKMIAEKSSPWVMFGFFILTIFHTTLKPFLNIAFSGKLYFYFAEDGIVGYIGYAVLGYILGKNQIKWDGLIIALGIVAMPVFAYLNFDMALDGKGFVFSGGYTLNHYLEAAAIFLLFKKIDFKKNKLMSLMSKLSFRAYLIHVFVIEQFKPLLDDFSPAVMMTAMFAITLLLSFGWAYIVECFYKLCKSFRKKEAVRHLHL